MKLAALGLFVSLAAVSLGGTPVRVVVNGHVGRNDFLSGTFFGVPDDVHNGTGALVKLVITLDSENYLDSAAYPNIVRGYRFGVNDLTLDVGNVHTVLRADRTVNYFSLRNNDPAVDGVFISQGTDWDTHIPLAMTPNGFGIAFARSFNVGTAFTSLDILQCTGAWAYEQIGSYNFTIQLGEFQTPMLFWYHDFSITKQCTPADIGSQGGVAGFDQQLDNNDFVVFINSFFASETVADFGSQGGVAGADGNFDNNDFVVFINTFFTGC